MAGIFVRTAALEGVACCRLAQAGSGAPFRDEMHVIVAVLMTATHSLHVAKCFLRHLVVCRRRRARAELVFHYRAGATFTAILLSDFPATTLLSDSPVRTANDAINSF